VWNAARNLDRDVAKYDFPLGKPGNSLMLALTAFRNVSIMTNDKSRLIKGIFSRAFSHPRRGGIVDRFADVD
jgi:hypothetical protein